MNNVILWVKIESATNSNYLSYSGQIDRDREIHNKNGITLKSDKYSELVQ